MCSTFMFRSPSLHTVNKASMFFFMVVKFSPSKLTLSHSDSILVLLDHSNGISYNQTEKSLVTKCRVSGHSNQTVVCLSKLYCRHHLNTLYFISVLAVSRGNKLSENFIQNLPPNGTNGLVEICK